MDADFLIIGAGIAGASTAYELSRQGRVVLLEREDQPGYHSTGRSAALFTEAYGNATIRALTRASRNFFTAPPLGFATAPLLTPRGVVTFAAGDRQAAFEAALNEMSERSDTIREIDLDRASVLFPPLDRSVVRRAHYEPNAMDMDVHAIHQGFLKGFARAAARSARQSASSGSSRGGPCMPKPRASPRPYSSMPPGLGPTRSRVSPVCRRSG
jgi:D-arginine dehydrogenase